MQDQQTTSELQHLSSKPAKTHLVRLTSEEYTLLELYRSNVQHVYANGLRDGRHHGDLIVRNTITTLSGLFSTIADVPVPGSSE